MSKENHRLFIKKSKTAYKKIECIECPAFVGEKIYFNKIGFNHLLWKGKKMRKPEEQIRRINLISKALEILESSKHFDEYRESKIRSSNSTSTAYFWSFVLKNKKGRIIVVIRQTNNGNKHFMSVI